MGGLSVFKITGDTRQVLLGKLSDESMNSSNVFNNITADCIVEAKTMLEQIELVLQALIILHSIIILSRLGL